MIVFLKRFPILTAVFIVIFLLADRITTKASTEIFVKRTAFRGSCNIHARDHIAKLRSTTESTYMTVEYICCNRSLNWLGIVDTTTIEVIDIGIINLPPHITVNLLQSCTCTFLKMTATDVTFGIIILGGSIRIIGTGEMEILVFTTRH